MVGRPSPSENLAQSVAALAVLSFEMRKTTAQVGEELRAYVLQRSLSCADLARAEHLLGTWTALRTHPAGLRDSQHRTQLAARVLQLNARLAARELIHSLLLERSRTS